MKKIRTSLVAAIAIGLLAGSAVGVAAQDKAADPVEFTAKWRWGSDIRSETTKVVTGGAQSRGGAWRPGVATAASDPRLQGTLSIANNSDNLGGVGGPLVNHYAFRIENEVGAWQQTPTLSFASPYVDQTSETALLVGERGYEGLIAVVHIASDREAETWDLHGYIIDGELPPAPEPFVSE